MSGERRAEVDWARPLPGLVAAFAVFQWSATALRSDRGQAGLLVAALVVGTILAAERVAFGRTVVDGARAIGLGTPRLVGVLAAAGVCVLILLAIPLFAATTGASVVLLPDWLPLLPGLFAQGGIAEEALFRGYLFGHIRATGRPFWPAVGLATIPFAVVHLFLFFTMPWPVALAALGLSLVITPPLAHLYELGGATVWAPALVHFVVQGAVKVIAVEGGAAASFPFVWMLASAAIPWLVFLVRRPRR